jgi:hypothetical protein
MINTKGSNFYKSTIEEGIIDCFKSINILCANIKIILSKYD